MTREQKIKEARKQYEAVEDQAKKQYKAVQGLAFEQYKAVLAGATDDKEDTK